VIRAAAELYYQPLRRLTTEVGNVCLLTGKTLKSALRPPYNYGPELVDQFLFVLRVGWFPMIVTSVAMAFGPAGIQSAGILKLFGALDRLGSIFVIVVVREFAPLVSAIVMAGVAGTAITADLGARKIREELDALMVLGVDPIKSLVVPRFLSLVVITTLFDIYALVFGVIGGMLVVIVNGAPLGPFFASFLGGATTIELAASLLKCALYGSIIAIVCCYKGLSASGGSEGVGRAVNQAVVISFLAIGAFDYIFTQTLLATQPSLSAIR
jgi:phospholipid/cholesterol/gamma-HCH transport system permease protein